MTRTIAPCWHRLLLSLFATMTSFVSADEIVVDYLMNREPAEKVQVGQLDLHPNLVSLWKQALARPESELKRQAAEAVAEAFRLGHDEVTGVVPELLKVIADKDAHPAARHAAAHALIVIDQRTTATALFEASQTGGKDLRLLVEPVLAKWNFEAIRPVWRLRLTSSTTQRRELLLAMGGLGEQRDADSLQTLLAFVLQAEKPSDIRLAAARAASQITDQGLEPQAQQLLARRQASVLDRLCAVVLVSRHQSDAMVALHQKMGTDTEPAVAGESLRSLFAIDPKLVLPLLDSALQSGDSNIRRVGIRICIAEPTPERLSLLAKRLNDPHLELRVAARNGLHLWSTDAAFDALVRQQTSEILAGDDWRGQEQAALLLGALDEEGAAARLLDLLEAKRPEVTIAAAWSLKSLEIAQTSVPVLAFAERVTAAPGKVTESMDERLAHLFELLGRLKAVEAIPLLKRYVPKGALSENSRAAAIWALGLILEGQNDEALAAQLMERTMDIFSMPPEYSSVRRASILTLGRLQAKSQLPTLKKLVGDSIDNDSIELTARWAILRISGEAIPIAPPARQLRTGWFLEPTTDPKK